MKVQRRKLSGVGGRQGLTLVELLIAMVVLLVGIYTVAAGFPRFLNAIRGEADRTTMARLAEQALTRLADNPEGLPEAITGGGNVSPRHYPEDLAAPHTEPNALEDIVEVRGETFRVPAPYTPPGQATGFGYYVLQQGPAQCTDWANGYPYVYLLVPLTEIEDDPRAAGAIPQESNWFYVDRRSGEIVVPRVVFTRDGQEVRRWGQGGLPGVSGVVVNYSWTTPPAQGGEEPIVRHVQGEIPSDVDTSQPGLLVAKVHPAHLPGGIRLLPGQTRVWARVDFVREPFGTSYPTAGGRYVLDNKYGLTLCFHPEDAGLTLKVDYQLRTYMTPEDQAGGGQPRRLPLVIEDQVIARKAGRSDSSGVDYALLRLAFKNIESEPLFDRDLQGNAITPVQVVAVDLQTGEIHDNGASADPFTLGEKDIFDPPLAGFRDGVVAVPITDSSGAEKAYVGHTWRFYYRTLNRHTIQVQKAPRYYVDSETARAYLAAYLPSGQDEAASLAEVDYRTYRLLHEPAPNDPGKELGVLEFGQWGSGEVWATAESSAGETVAVSYIYTPVPHERRYVWGELHTVPVGGYRITLNQATVAGHPIEILAVNGVSARAKGFWLNRAGRLRVLEAETIFVRNALELLPRVR